MARTPVATAEVRKQLATGDAQVTCPKCRASVPLHGMHWVHEVCPQCLQTFFWGSGADYNLYTDHGFWDAAGQQAIRANIARNGGRYIPTFS